LTGAEGGFFFQGSFQGIPGFHDVFLGGAGKIVDIIQTIKTANPGLILPIQPDQGYSCRNHLISVAVKGGMNQHISSAGVNTSVVSGFLEAPA